MDQNDNQWISFDHNNININDGSEFIIQENSKRVPNQMNGTNQLPCKFYQIGQCTKGNKCPFMHKIVPHFSSQPCKFFANGYCRNSDRCPFLHVKPGEVQNFHSSEIPQSENVHVLSSQFFPQQHSPIALTHEISSSDYFDYSAQDPTVFYDDTNQVVSLPSNHPSLSSQQNYALLKAENDQMLLSDTVNTVFDSRMTSVQKNPSIPSHLNLFDDIWTTSPTLFQSTSQLSSTNMSLSSSTPLFITSADTSTRSHSNLPNTFLLSNQNRPQRSTSYFSLPQNQYVDENQLTEEPDILNVPTSLTHSILEENQRNNFSSSNYIDNYHNFLSNKVNLQNLSLITKKTQSPSFTGRSPSILSLPPLTTNPNTNVNELSENNETDELSFLKDFESVLSQFEEEPSSPSSPPPQNHLLHTSTIQTLPTSLSVSSSSELIVTSSPSSLRSPRYSTEHHSNNKSQSQTVTFLTTNTNSNNIQNLSLNHETNTSQTYIITNDGNNNNNNNIVQQNVSEVNEMIKAAEIFQDHDNRHTQTTDHETTHQGSLTSLQSVTPTPSWESELSPSLQSPSSQTKKSRQQLCTFYMEDKCRYGDLCRNIHGNICEICLKAALIPNDPEQNKNHIKECSQRQKLLKTLESSKDYECGICGVKIMASGRKFGILTSCIHTFCVGCVKEWRQKHQSNECPNPQCGTTSPFIVPSPTFILDPNKKQLIVNLYKEKINKIPCKYFDHGRGTCKFGLNCLYAHVDPEGRPLVQTQRSFTSDNYTASKRQKTSNDIKLGMFLSSPPKQKKDKRQ